jgi:predicted TIM-barrel fold metal-dependent hydrolase
MDALWLVDGHCHTVVADPVDAAAFALWCSEASVPAPPGVSYLDSQVGAAVRRWCAPVLDLPSNAPPPEYLARRRELGPAEVTRRLLTAAGLTHLLVDTGLPGPAAPGRGQARAARVAPADLGAAAGATVGEVVRLEYVAQTVAADGCDASGFDAAFREALSDATAQAVAVKSVLAYRHGLDVEPTRPSAAEVRAAAAGWLRERDAGRPRLTDPVLLRHLLWCGVDTGLPIQVHTGFGDRDLALARADPALLQPFCAAVEPSGVPLVLLHCYPYHRQAGWLAQVYPHVYVDIGLTITHVGARAGAVLAEYLELAPFGKLLYSSDAYGLPELYRVGAAQFRHFLGRILDGWVSEGALTTADARRIAAQIGARNAMRLYGLDPVNPR